MGITGLLPALKQISESKNVFDLANMRVGIDAYGWLHRSTYSCALELCRNEPTTAYVDYCISRLRLLLANAVTPILVFDGAELPQKAGTHAERRASRAEARARAEQAYNAGDIAKAREWYQRGCLVTSEMAIRVFRAARRINVQCVVAPYEADAQLAWMMRAGYCDAVISEDSDLLVYGAQRVMYKFGKDGSGVMIQLDHFGHLKDLPLSQFTPDMFMYMCVCAGCDFFKGVKGLGIRKAHALVKRHRTLPRIIRAVYLDRKLGVNRQSFAQDFSRACLVFRHQTVLDLRSCKTVPLSPIDDNALEMLPEGAVQRDVDGTWDLHFLGRNLDDEIASKIANGLLNPHTLDEYNLPAEPVPRPRTRTSLPTPERISMRTTTASDPASQRQPSQKPSNPNGFVIQPATANGYRASSTTPQMPQARRRLSESSARPPLSLPSSSGSFDPRREARRFSLTNTGLKNQNSSTTSTTPNLLASNSTSAAVWAKFKRTSSTAPSAKRERQAPQSGDQHDECSPGATSRNVNEAETPNARQSGSPNETEDNLFASTDNTDVTGSHEVGDPATAPKRDDVEEKVCEIAKPDSSSTGADQNDNQAQSRDAKQSEDGRPPANSGISRVMRRFAARPIDKRLKFADSTSRSMPSSTLTKSNAPGSGPTAERPPSPDHDSFRLFDEIDGLSNDATERAEAGDETKTSIGQATPSSSGDLASPFDRATPTRPPAKTPLNKKDKSTVKGTSTRSPVAAATSGTRRRQVLVSRFFASSSGSNNATDGPSRAQRPPVKASQSRNDRPRTPAKSESPSEKVAAAMTASGFSPAEQRRAQKRKIDNFRRGAAGKKVRVGGN